MVVDTMENIGKYVSLNPLFEEMVKFIASKSGVTSFTAKTEEEAVFETHRKMIDVQIPLDAPETYGYTPLCDLPEVEYNEEKDITKYPGVKAETLVNCKPGEFAIFFPQDGHQPCIGTGTIHKAIFKIKA